MCCCVAFQRTKIDETRSALERVLCIFNQHLQDMHVVSTQIVVLKAAQSVATHYGVPQSPLYAPPPMRLCTAAP